MDIFWMMTLIGILVGGLVGDSVVCMVSGYMGSSAWRETLVDTLGDRGTLGTGAGVVSIGDVTGGGTLRDVEGSDKVVGERLGLF